MTDAKDVSSNETGGAGVEPKPEAARDVTAIEQPQVSVRLV